MYIYNMIIQTMTAKQTRKCTVLESNWLILYLCPKSYIVFGLFGGFHPTREFFTHSDTSQLPVKFTNVDLYLALMATEKRGFPNVPSDSNSTYKKFLCSSINWLIDWIQFNAVSAILQPCNGDLKNETVENNSVNFLFTKIFISLWAPIALLGAFRQSSENIEFWRRAPRGCDWISTLFF